MNKYPVSEPLPVGTLVIYRSDYFKVMALAVPLEINPRHSRILLPRDETPKNADEIRYVLKRPGEERETIAPSAEVLHVLPC